MKRSSVLLAALLCLLPACKTPVAGLQQHASFTYEATAMHLVVIGGVVSSHKQLTEIKRIRFGDLLGRTLHTELPHIKTVPTGSLRKALGQQPFNDLLDAYRLTGVITQQDVTEIQAVFPDARYLMLCNIEQDKIDQEQHETETETADSEEDRKQRNFDLIRVDLSLITSRDLGASFLIYDLKDHQVMWAGFIHKTISKSSDSSRTFRKTFRWHDGFINDESVERNYPKAATQVEVLEEIFSGFAENMPAAAR